MASKSDTQQQSIEIEELAGGWITERKHTNVPTFLRFSYIVIGICAVSYLILQIYGDTGVADRASLVEQFNQATMTSPALMYTVAAMVGLFFLAVILFAFRDE